MYAGMFFNVDTEEVLSRVGDVIAMRDAARERCRQRALRLKDALVVAERFHCELTEISAEMHRIRDLAIRSHELPAISADIVRQQLNDLQVITVQTFCYFNMFALRRLGNGVSRDLIGGFCAGVM